VIHFQDEGFVLEIERVQAKKEDFLGIVFHQVLVCSLELGQFDGEGFAFFDDFMIGLQNPLEFGL
jgi:hypothetical protein